MNPSIVWVLGVLVLGLLTVVVGGALRLPANRYSLRIALNAFGFACLSFVCGWLAGGGIESYGDALRNGVIFAVAGASWSASLWLYFGYDAQAFERAKAHSSPEFAQLYAAPERSLDSPIRLVRGRRPDRLAAPGPLVQGALAAVVWRNLTMFALTMAIPVVTLLSALPVPWDYGAEWAAGFGVAVLGLSLVQRRVVSASVVAETEDGDPVVQVADPVRPWLATRSSLGEPLWAVETSGGRGIGFASPRGPAHTVIVVGVKRPRAVEGLPEIRAASFAAAQLLGLRVRRSRQ